MFLSLYVFPSPITPVLSSSKALNCDHGKPWKHKQTDGNSRQRGVRALHGPEPELAFSVLSKQHLLLEHSCPQSRCLSSSDCAFDHPKMSGREHSFCTQPSLPENQNPAEIPIQTTGCHVHELGVGWRLPWPGTWFLSLLRLFNPELEVRGSMFLQRCLRQTSCNTWKGNVIRSGAGFITQTQQLCRSWCVLIASSTGSDQPLWPGGFPREPRD